MAPPPQTWKAHAGRCGGAADEERNLPGPNSPVILVFILLLLRPIYHLEIRCQGRKSMKHFHLWRAAIICRVSFGVPSCRRPAASARPDEHNIPF